MCRAIWVGFWVENCLNKGHFFGRFPSNMGGFSRNWQKIVKMGSFPQKFIVKVGMMATVGNWKRVVAFRKPGGRPTSIRK